MKSLNQMDLDEWELLPDEGFLEINDDGGKKIYSRKYPQGSSFCQMNYFMCPSPEFVEHPRMPNQLLPLPIDLDPTTLKPDDDQERVTKEVTEIPHEVKITKESDYSSSGGDQDPIAQVFFKKMKETEKFVDMKMDSPKSSSRGIMAQSQSEGAGAFQFGEKEDEKAMKADKDGCKWRLCTGIGAICSFGVAAAATFCIILFSHHKNNQKLHFQIYSNHKRASKVNEVIAGVPMSRAHISCGGYYDAAAAASLSL